MNGKKQHHVCSYQTTSVSRTGTLMPKFKQNALPLNDLEKKEKNIL